MSLRYGVIGTGALGGFYGGKLAFNGKDVHFLFRSDLGYVQGNGLKIDSINGNFHLHKINAYGSTTEMPVCDVILVCLKTTSNHLLPNLLKPILHKDSVIILVQNGLGLEADLAEQLPEANIAGGLAFICSSKIGDGHIAHLDYGKINIGSYNLKEQNILQQVCDDFCQAGVPADLSDNLMLSRWQKLVWNIPFNGMTVVMNTTTDQIMKNEAMRQLSLELMLEVIRGANQCGVPLPESFAHKMIEMTLSMTPYAPSMKLDFDYRRPMEIEYIYSKPVKTARKAGYLMEKVSMLEAQLKFIQANY